jgi:hypothetical protein
MSRIQDILNKAERDGTARRTRALHDEYAPRPVSDDSSQGRAFVEPSPSPRPLPDEARAPRPQAYDSPRVAPSVPEAPRVTPPSPRIVPSALDAPRLAPFSHETPNVVRALRHETVTPPAPVITEPPHVREAAAPVMVGHAPAPPVVTPGLETQLDPHLVAALAPTSLAAEQYRSLRTRLKRAESGRSVRTIAVTSPSKGDGKSLTAANLALTMAQEFQNKVLLIDCDLRRPSVHQLFGLNDGPGLGDVLMNVAELDHALVSLPEYHLTVLPAGLPPSHPAELLG